jgi:hypothetical protein
MKQHPPNLRRCRRCDKEGVELVERNHRYPQQPEGEIIDLYKCSFCGHKIQMLVQRSTFFMIEIIDAEQIAGPTAVGAFIMTKDNILTEFRRRSPRLCQLDR